MNPHPPVPEALAEYDRLRDRLRTAQAETSAARSHYHAALAAEAMIERDLAHARGVLTALITGTPDSVALSTPSPADDLEHMFDELDTTPDGARAESAPPKLKPPTTAPAPAGIRQSFWELILCFPNDGTMGVAELRERFSITDAGLNTRIMKAKQAGLIESAGWGRYRLTAEGRAIRDRRLTVVAER